MMTPDELQAIGETLLPYIDELNQWITNRIIENMMLRIGRGEEKMLTASDTWRYQVYLESGGNDTEMLEQIVKFTESTETEIRQIFEDAGLRAFAADSKLIAETGQTPLESMSPRMVEIMQDAYNRTLGEMHNFTRTTATQSQATLIKAMDNAYFKVMSGADSYTSAVKDAVNEVAKTQTRVEYPSGHSDTIEVAILRTVRTGTAQATSAMTIQRTLDEGWNHFRISEHLGARTHDTNPIANHFLWQGGVYTIVGGTDEYPNLKEKTGYPDDPLGFAGYGCRHSGGPFLPGVSVLPESIIDEEENREREKQEQWMRHMERGIRKAKTVLLGLRTSIDTCTDEEATAKLQLEYDKVAAGLQEQNRAYGEYAEKHGLKKLYDRISIAKWNRSEAAKATAAARRANKAKET